MTTLAEEARAAVAEGLAEADSLRVDAFWVSVRPPLAYAAGSGSPASLETEYPVRVLFVDLERRHEGDGIEPGDRMAILDGADVVWTPSLSDRVKVDGERWNVVRLFADPAGAAVRAQVRRMGGRGA